MRTPWFDSDFLTSHRISHEWDLSAAVQEKGSGGIFGIVGPGTAGFLLVLKWFGGEPACTTGVAFQSEDPPIDAGSDADGWKPEAFEPGGDPFRQKGVPFEVEGQNFGAQVLTVGPKG